MDFKIQYFEIWSKVWNLHKRYHDIRPDDEQRWKQLDQECERLDKQHENRLERKFMQSLLLAVVGELERSGNGETTGSASET